MIFDRKEKVCYNRIVALRKGGIIIEYKSKSVLLKRGLIIIPMAILGITIFSNASYATNSITGTKDRIKEIKIVEEKNIDQLIRNKKTKLAINYTRNTTTTSRSEVDREIKQEKTKQEKAKKEQKYINPNEVKISKNMDLTKRTGLSKEDFKKVIKNLKQDKSKFFYNNADTIYDLCKKYQINEFFFCGLISAESGWNIASNHRKTHNYISLMSKGKLIKYSSTKEGLEVAAKKLHYNYLTPGGKFYGGKTIAGVQKRFCPASKTWDDLVYSGMKYMLAAAKKTK